MTSTSAILFLAVVSTVVTLGLLVRTGFLNEQRDHDSTLLLPYVRRNRSLLIVAWLVTAGLWIGWWVAGRYGYDIF